MNNLKPTYRLVETKVTPEELGVYHTFGIEAVWGEKVLQRVEEISLHKDAIKTLIEKCNRGELSILHFMDVVEDFLADAC